MRFVLTRRRQEDVEWVLAGNGQPQLEIDLREGDLCTLRFEMDAPELAGLGQVPGDMRLMLSGVCLDYCRYEETGGGLRVTWQWRIEFYAGEITLDLLCGEKAIWACLLDVRPHAGKLGREAYGELLADLHARAENIIFGATPAQRSVAEADVRTPSIARLAMLQAHIRELERSFAAIAMSPNRQLVAERETRPLDRARIIDTRAFRGIVRSPAALAGLGLVSADRTELLERPRVDHPRREHTLNTPPNRHIAATIRHMQLFCRDLHAAFLNLAAREDDPETQMRALSFGAEAAALGRRVVQLSRADFLETVEAVYGDTAAMITIAKDPAYSRFDSIAQRVLRPRVCPGASLCEKLWLRRTYELYEYWRFFRVAECLTDAWGDLQWRSSITPTNGRLFVELPDESHIEASVGTTRIRLTFQQTFPAYDQAFDDGLKPYSISGQRRPDMVLSLRDGSQATMIVLDAKYRCGRDSIHAALGDMHVYRDSLKVSGPGVKILGAYIITPAHDPGAAAYFTEQYRGKYCTGGFDLAPGNMDQAGVLRQHLSTLLASQVHGQT